MKIQNFRSSLCQVLLGILFVGMFSTCKRNDLETNTLKVSLWANENHTWYNAFIYFKKIVEERSEGRLNIEVYPSEQLAKEIESIRLIQADVIDMTVTASLLSNWIDIAVFCEMPYLLKNNEEKDQLLYGPIGQRVEKEMLEKTGLRPLAVFERGARHLTSNRPIKHPDDLKGMIVRVPNVPSFVTAWSALGAKPTPMAFSEVFTSLQQGTIDGQENPFALILSSGFSEVQKYVNLTGHVMSWSYPVIGEKQFQRLPKDLQEIVSEAALDMQDFEKKLFIENEANVQRLLKEKGMEFIKVDKKAFSEKCENQIYESLSSEMKALYKEFKTSIEE